MELKYEGKSKITQGGKNCEIDVYSNELSLTGTEQRLFFVEMGRIIANFYQNPENQKKFEEWEKIKFQIPNCSVQKYL